MPAGSLKPTITLRDLKTFDDLKQVETVERAVWGISDRDTIPLTLAVATRAAGNIWIGAFDGPRLVGFVFGFLGTEDGRLTVHSHALAVLPSYRDAALGYRLKLAQRERVLHMGESEGLDSLPQGLRVGEITWTFDPLQSKNAHLNFEKLGVVSGRYEVDFYGPETSSMLHQNGTDRLWLRWPISSRHVQERLQGKSPRAEVMDALSLLPPLITFNGNGRPARGDLAEALGRQRIAIEIPSDIGAIEQENPELAREWRMATRWAFTDALQSGFFVAEFCRNVRGQQGPGVYLLEKRAIEEAVPELTPAR